MSKTTVRQKHRLGFEELARFWSRLEYVEKTIDGLSDRAPRYIEEPLNRIRAKIYAFEPSVSVIGQIKSGKSTLLNSMVGETNLLPSDVNPWTSVITAMHLNSRTRPAGMRAVFRFFDRHEWDRLVATGGRLGELSARAGFDREVDEVKQQVLEMRQTTEARLGSEFETLLGTSRAYEELDQDVINRYICYGDPSELEADSDEGVYADLTKAADLYLDVDGLPSGLCLRDTPGVNDTFMMREQITLNAISDSRVCIVVLSAHQALSTMDVALLRIICAVEAREVLIFVNRIDELAEPARETERIEASIRSTLKRLGFTDEIEILFGSGYWANFALSGASAMPRRSRQALAALSPETDLSDIDAMRAAAYEASGVHALLLAVTRRVVEGPGTAFLRDVSTEVETVLKMRESVDEAATLYTDHGATPGISTSELARKIDAARDHALAAFDAAASDLRAQLRERLEQAQATFVSSATEALGAHIGSFGEQGAWTHDPTGLRMMMKSAYFSSCVKLRRIGETGLEDVCEGIEHILRDELGVFRQSATIKFPEQVQHSAPTVLARTIALDLSGNWWRRWLEKGGVARLIPGRAERIEKRYRSMIEAETDPLIEDLLDSCFDPATAKTREIIATFATDQARYGEALLDRIKRPDHAVSDPLDAMDAANARRSA
ncbi:MAG: dynamin family protein [Paracoccaceae bacterium]|nr:dynamin family protein [Paracoccaceae bacterium]